MMDTVNEQNPASCISYVVNYKKSDVSFLRLQEASLKIMSFKKSGSSRVSQMPENPCSIQCKNY